MCVLPIRRFHLYASFCESLHILRLINKFPCQTISACYNRHIMRACLSTIQNTTSAHERRNYASQTFQQNPASRFSGRIYGKHSCGSGLSRADFFRGGLPNPVSFPVEAMDKRSTRCSSITASWRCSTAARRAISRCASGSQTLRDDGRFRVQADDIIITNGLAAGADDDGRVHARPRRQGDRRGPDLSGSHCSRSTSLTPRSCRSPSTPTASTAMRLAAAVAGEPGREVCLRHSEFPEPHRPELQPAGTRPGRGDLPRHGHRRARG